jgi:hypothetical protein
MWVILKLSADDKDDPAFIISDTDDLIDLIYGKRTQIEGDSET